MTADETTLFETHDDTKEFQDIEQQKVADETRNLIGYMRELSTAKPTLLTVPLKIRPGATSRVMSTGSPASMLAMLFSRKSACIQTLSASMKVITGTPALA